MHLRPGTHVAVRGTSAVLVAPWDAHSGRWIVRTEEAWFTEHEAHIEPARPLSVPGRGEEIGAGFDAPSGWRARAGEPAGYDALARVTFEGPEGAAIEAAYAMRGGRWIPDLGANLREVPAGLLGNVGQELRQAYCIVLDGEREPPLP